MNVKKIVEIIEATPTLADDPAGLLILLNSKTSKKQKEVLRPVGKTRLPTSTADENGGDATQEDVDAAIALFEKKKKGKNK
jgi:hypothetical protein